MTERKAAVYIKPGVYDIETDLKGKAKDDRANRAKDDQPFGDYKENQGRLILIHDICSVNGESLLKAIEYCQKHQRPAFVEIFIEVKIYDMYTGKVLETLVNVDLTGILQGLQEVMRNKYVA